MLCANHSDIRIAVTRRFYHTHPNIDSNMTLPRTLMAASGSGSRQHIDYAALSRVCDSAHKRDGASIM